ncbi:MAG: hypothetical protein ACE5GE_01195 [Phycisphaerae bacterium]
MRIGQIHSGSAVQFRLGDAVCPEFGQLATQMSPEVTVCGEVVFFSDCGTMQNHFAIIAVGGLDTPLVVPTDRLMRSSLTPAEQPGQDRQGLPPAGTTVDDSVG